MSESRGPRVIRVWVIVVCTVLGVFAGAAGGMWFSSWQTGKGAAKGTAAAQDEQWYTCGMHPQVIQKGPGNCPICGMKLTPLKKGEGDKTSEQAGPRERKILYWRAPMDPNYVSDKPGKSPMGMDLVPVYSDEDASPGSRMIRIDPMTIQNMGIRTRKIQRGPLVKTIRTVGRIDYDEQRVTFINTKFDGWIEKLDVDETGQHVEKGQPLFDVYSRELYSAQEEYLAAVRGLERVSTASEAVQQQARDLLEAARTKLKYLDVSEQQIEQLAGTGEVKKTLTILSPATGIVTEKMALEGMFIKPGMKLYTIADLSKVWVYVDIYEYQLPWVSVGQSAIMTLPYIPGKTYRGKVVYVYPYLDEKTRVVRVRLEFENPNLELKPGMFANIVLKSELEQNALLIPREAYIDTGTRQVAFQYLGEGKFLPRDIQVGVQGEGEIVEVLSGLDAGDVVVTSGQFLIDAESKLKEAVAKMMEPGKPGEGAMSMSTEKQASPSHVSSAAGADGDRTPVQPERGHEGHQPAGQGDVH